MDRFRDGDHGCSHNGDCGQCTRRRYGDTRGSQTGERSRQARVMKSRADGLGMTRRTRDGQAGWRRGQPEKWDHGWVKNFNLSSDS